MDTVESIVEVMVMVGVGYALAGLSFALAFVTRGVSRIDPSAADASWRFRLVIVPGVAAFWPLLLHRWWTGTQPPTERTAHHAAAEGSKS